MTPLLHRIHITLKCASTCRHPPSFSCTPITFENPLAAYVSPLFYAATYTENPFVDQVHSEKFVKYARTTKPGHGAFGYSADGEWLL